MDYKLFHHDILLFLIIAFGYFLGGNPQKNITASTGFLGFLGVFSVAGNIFY
jgi:hypothetical protein